MRDDHHAAGEVVGEEALRAGRGRRSRGRWSARRGGTRRSGRSRIAARPARAAWPPESAGISRSRSAVGQAEVGEHRADAGVEVGARRARGTRRARAAYASSAPALAGRERVRSRPSSAARPRSRRCGARGSARTRLAGRAARAPAGGSRRSRSAACASTAPVSGGRCPARIAQQRRLAGAVGRDDADPAARADGDVHAVEHDVRTERLGDVAGDEASDRRAEGEDEDTAAPAGVRAGGKARACRVTTSGARIARW